MKDAKDQARLRPTNPSTWSQNVNVNVFLRLSVPTLAQ